MNKKKYALVFTKNLHSEYLGCNQYFAQLLGLRSCLDVVGKTDFDFHWATSHANLYRERDLQVFAGYPLINFIESHPLPNGKIISVNVNKIPIYDNHGNVKGLTCQFQSLPPSTSDIKLTAIQTECLYYLTQGFTAKEIAKKMFLSNRTIEFYLAILKNKLNCRNKAELIAKALTFNFF